MTDSLPSLREEELRIWDEKKQLCGGYLDKKASKSSAFSKGRWQKRWFFIRTKIAGHENFMLEYSYSPDDKSSRQIYPLEGAAVVIDAGNSFQLTLSDGTTALLAAESPQDRDNWIFTLEHAISVANSRSKMIRTRQNLETVENGSEVGLGGDGENKVSRNRSSSNADSSVASRPFQIHQRANPKLRLDVDINSIPPSSPARRHFEEMFCNDVANALHIDLDMVEIISLKPALGMDWLTVVEFDIIVFADDDRTLTTVDDAPDDSSEVKRQGFRRKLLWRLNEMVVDTSSPLYNGFITCKLDSGFANNLVEANINDLQVELYSAEPRVMAILNKYKDVVVPDDYMDTSHFTIVVRFEDKMVPVSVPNPLVLPRRRHCFLWPFEVKQALGLTGTMQELWIEPVALVPCDMPKSLSQPIRFEPSVRLGGAEAINAVHLKADLTYELECDDFRNVVRESLTEEELAEIQSTFDEYDVDGNGLVSRFELENLTRRRVQERKDVVEQKYEELVNDRTISNADLQRAEEAKRQHLQHLTEAQSKLISMFEAADLNGDNSLSFDEFLLMEVWWRRCTLNPNQAHLF